MPKTETFKERLEKKVRAQLKEARAFLLGAGSSYLNGKGYPLTTELWDVIRPKLDDADRKAIQDKINGGATGIEQALDLLDTGSSGGFPLRHNIAKIVAEHFRSMDIVSEAHQQFVTAIGRFVDYAIPIFSLNYDPLIERSAELKNIRWIDGFVGAENAHFTHKISLRALC